MAELFTLEDLAAYRRSDAPYQPDDDAAVRAAATGLCRGFCGWHVAPPQTEAVSVIVRDDGAAGAELFLPSLHITTKPTVTLADASSPTDFSWSAGGWVKRASGWGLTDDVLTFQVTHGYPEGSTQHQLIRGVALGVAARLINTGESPTAAALLPEEEAQLYPLRLFVVA